MKTPGGMIVLYLCAQLAVLNTYNCTLILIYWLGQNLLIINKYAVNLYNCKGLAYITLYTITSLEKTKVCRDHFLGENILKESVVFWNH